MAEDNEIQRYEPAPRALERRRPAPLATSYEVMEMEEPQDLLAYWRVLRKRSWTILTVFLVVFVLVLLATLRQTPVYSATALLEIEKEDASIPTVQELFELDTVSDTYLETQYKILQSASLARSVIDELGLTKLAEFNPPPSWPWAHRKAKTEEDSDNQTFVVGEAPAEAANPVAYQITMDNFQERLLVTPIENSRLVRISFESVDPALAARIVNTVAANYVERNLEARWEATQKASEWLSQQLVTLKGKLEAAENELQRYARENGLLFLETESGNPESLASDRLRSLQEELTNAQADRYRKESLYTLVQAGNYEALPGVADNSTIRDLTVTLAQLQQQYAQLSTTFTPDYPKVKEVQSQINEIESALTRERERAAHQIANDYRAAVERENLLHKAFDLQQQEVDVVAEKAVQYNILRREVETNKQLYEGLLTRLREAGVSAGLKASNIRIVDAAVTPQYPVRPRVLLNLALALMFGMGLGVGTAFLQEYLDNTLKSAEDVERYLRVPALALIPSVESLNGRRGGVYGIYGRAKSLTGGEKRREPSTQLVPAGTAAAAQKRWYRIDGENQAHSTLGEAFRSLRTSVLLSTAEHPPRSLVISSAQPGEGKTTISTNLSISLAQLGRRVLLVDGDLRRPSLHRVFQANNNRGVVSYLTGQEDWRDVVEPTGVPGLEILPCGPVPPNPAELLSSERMRLLVRETIGEYDFVLLDSPPLLNVADSRILITLVDGVVLVVKGGATPRELVQHAQAHARTVGGNIIGVVLNNLDLRSESYYYYYRYYRYDYYGQDEDTKST
jgi:succinoglycan biosynthesis transport protein ExoP